MGLDTKTYRLTDRQSQCDFDFDFDFDLTKAAVNMDPQQWETVFSVESVQRSYLKSERRYDSDLSSEFSVEDSHGKFVDL
jgi:hypothetical protein